MDAEHLSKLQERVQQHDIEFAELRAAVKTIADTGRETKTAVKDISKSMQAITEILHKIDLRDQLASNQVADFRKDVERVREEMKEVKSHHETLTGDIRGEMDTKCKAISQTLADLQVFIFAARYPKVTLVVVLAVVAVFLNDVRDKLFSLVG